MREDTVEVVAYDPNWPSLYAAERTRIVADCPTYFVAFEHIGSTAVPGLRSKPIIDMMAAVQKLGESTSLVQILDDLGYEVFETGMRERLFLRRYTPEQGRFHLHIVEQRTWDERKERHMRDYLLAHPDAVRAYGELKDDLARLHAEDSLAYTKAKTAFIQSVIDQVQDARGLPRFDVWED
jgi:GrpB-like predicted nucleotidyltransferase (UPF0157 family)